MSKAKTIADAVAARINAADLSIDLADTPAIVSFAPDYKLPELKELTIVVGPLQSKTSARMTEQSIGVYIQQKIDNSTPEDTAVSDLLTFCEEIEALFYGFSISSINAFMTEIIREPLFDFDKLREDSLFAAGFELKFKVIT
jgi:hypothetical protein